MFVRSRSRLTRRWSRPPRCASRRLSARVVSRHETGGHSIEGSSPDLRWRPHRAHGPSMGHARREELLDIADVLDKVRSLPGVSERSPGIFYIGRTSFLHFHTKAGDRWAD